MNTNLTKTSGHEASNLSGGPQTEAGKAKSRLNAVTHGLTATTLLPAILGSNNIERHRERLRQEWQPATATESLLVDEVARHAAALDFIEQAEPAVLRTGAGAMILVQKGLNAFSGLAAPEEFGLAAAVTSEAAERLSRYRRAHEKGLHQGLQRLRELRADSPQRPVLNLIRPL